MEGNGQQYITVGGTVTGVVFHNSENGYTVLRVATQDETITAVGCFPGISCGEEIVMEGTFVSHQSYGEQFKAERVQRRMPTNKKAIYEYLAFGAVKGVGPATAAAIVTQFGDKTLEIMENEPERLAEIKGISPRKALSIGNEFKRSVGLRRLMEFVGAAGIKPQVAIRLYKCYGDEAMEAVRDNPYIITHEFFGADFFEADTLAETLGFELDCPQRVEAAVIFELIHNLSNGHVFLPENKLSAAVAQLIGVEDSLIVEAMDMLCEGGYIIKDEIAGLTAVYLERLHFAETYVAERISQMVDVQVLGNNDADKLIAKIERKLGIKYADLQREAIKTAAESNIMALTGGPGTGKTTSVRGILAMLDELGIKSALAAPTGRAAKRMSELTGHEAFTIHRLLGAGYGGDDNTIVFEHDEIDPIDAGAIILDEASMIDVTLMAALLAATAPDCRLILVGDADQLPSVGPGNVFSDIIRSELVPTIKLNEIFRQAKESHIIRNAHLINQGIVPELGENKGDFFFLGRGSEERTVETIVELCSKRLPGKMGIDPGDIQVLSPGRKRIAGTINLNRRLQEALNPPTEDKKEKEYGEFVFREGDRVMQIRNNYDIMWRKQGEETSGTGIFNGDIGKIVSIDKSRELMFIDFDGKIAAYQFEQMYEIEPAFAMTVHKSQGSEYKTVILSAYGGAPALLTRGVLYTAVTRAKNMLIIVGDSETVTKMTLDERKQRRYSGLKLRLSACRG